jgi:hypothetical protein
MTGDQAFVNFIDTVTEVFDKDPYQAKDLLEELLQWLNGQEQYKKYIHKVNDILSIFQQSIPLYSLEKTDFVLPYQAGFTLTLSKPIITEGLSILFLDHQYQGQVNDKQNVNFELNYAKPGTYELDLFQHEQKIQRFKITIKSLIEMDDLGL